MAEMITLAVIIIVVQILARIVWYLQGMTDGLKKARRIVEKQCNGKEQGYDSMF